MMRSFLLVLSIVIGVSLSANAPDVAAATSAKIGKSKVHKAGRSHSGKEAKAGSGDVWARIRSGMKIPNSDRMSEADETYGKNRRSRTAFSSAFMKMHEMSPASGHAQIQSAPVQRYTELGRSKLNQHNYTPLGLKLLGAKSPAIGTDCTPPSRATAHSRGLSQVQSKLTLLKERAKTGKDLGTELRLNEGDLEKMREFKTWQNHSRALNGHTDSTALATRIRAGQTARSSSAAGHCPEPQLTAVKSNGKDPKLTHNREQRQAQSNKQTPVAERINQFVAAYSQNPDYLYRIAERARPYLYHIVEELGKHRMPMDLALLPIVESAYQPTAESPKSAKGLWQFIPSTGRDYNLIQSHDYDERLDVAKSTQAAIRFLSGLNNHYGGDWLLALAAYNSGQATVDNAISQNRANGLATDFWSLDLPEETQNYVPRLLALTKIFARPSDFGIKLPAIKNEPYFVKVKFEREFDVNYLAEKEITTIAKLADMKHEQFSRLNPGYLGSNLARRRSYAFLMPLDNANQLRQRLASIAQFMSEPTLPVNQSIVLKENPGAYFDLYDASLSLVSKLVLNKPVDDAKFSTPFLSLNFDGEQLIPKSIDQPLV